MAAARRPAAVVLAVLVAVLAASCSSAVEMEFSAPPPVPSTVTADAIPPAPNPTPTVPGIEPRNDASIQTALGTGRGAEGSQTAPQAGDSSDGSGARDTSPDDPTATPAPPSDVDPPATPEPNVFESDPERQRQEDATERPTPTPTPTLPPLPESDPLIEPWCAGPAIEIGYHFGALFVAGRPDYPPASEIYPDVLRAWEDLQPLAPVALKQPLADLIVVQRDMNEIFAANDWDRSAGIKWSEHIDTDTMVAASDALGFFALKVCGVPSGLVLPGSEADQAEYLRERQGADIARLLDRHDITRVQAECLTAAWAHVTAQGPADGRERIRACGVADNQLVLIALD